MNFLKNFFKNLYREKTFYYRTEQLRYEREMDKLKTTTYWKAG